MIQWHLKYLTIHILYAFIILSLTFIWGGAQFFYPVKVKDNSNCVSPLLNTIISLKKHSLSYFGQNWSVISVYFTVLKSGSHISHMCNKILIKQKYVFYFNSTKAFIEEAMVCISTLWLFVLVIQFISHYFSICTS